MGYSFRWHFCLSKIPGGLNANPYPKQPNIGMGQSDHMPELSLQGAFGGRTGNIT